MGCAALMRLVPVTEALLAALRRRTGPGRSTPAAAMVARSATAARKGEVWQAHADPLKERVCNNPSYRPKPCSKEITVLEAFLFSLFSFLSFLSTGVRVSWEPSSH